jgi:hypothetical protein
MFITLCGTNNKADDEEKQDSEEYYDIINNVYIEENQIRDTSQEQDEENDNSDKPFPEVEDDDFKDGMAIININNKYGFINQDREIIVEPIYDNIGDERFQNGLARVNLEDKWGYIDRDGNVVIELQYEYASSFDDNGIAEVSKNMEFFEIDKNGNKITKDNDTNPRNLDILMEKFLVNKSNIKMEIEMTDGRKTRDAFVYDAGRRSIILTEPEDETYMWNIPIDYSGVAKTAIILTIFNNNKINLAIASNDIVIAQEEWESIEASPIILKRNGLIIQRVHFNKDWSPNTDSDKMKSISILEDSFIVIELNESDDDIKEDDTEKVTDENKKNLTKQKIPVFLEDFVQAYVLNVIDFDINNDIYLIEVRMLGERNFIQLIGLKRLHHDMTIDFLEEKILYKNVFLEKDIIISDNINKDRYLRYLWLDIPEMVYDEDLKVYFIEEYDIKNKLLNYILIKRGYVLPRLKKEDIKKYDAYFLDAYRNREKISLTSNPNLESTPSSIINTDSENKETSNTNEKLDNGDEENQNDELSVEDYDEYYDTYEYNDESYIEDTEGSNYYAYDYCSIDCNTEQRVGSLCKDGTYSDATGRGACSGHGGVECWLCVY